MKNWKHWSCKILENTVHCGQCEILKCLLRLQYGIESKSPGYEIKVTATLSSLRPTVILLLLGFLLHLGLRRITLRTFITFRAKIYFIQDLQYIQGQNFLHLGPLLQLALLITYEASTFTWLPELTCGRRFRRTFSIKSQRNCLHVDKSVFYVVALAANELQQTR